MLELPEALVVAGQIDKVLKGKRLVKVEAGHTPHGFAFYQGNPQLYPGMLEGLRLDRTEQSGGRVELFLEDMRLTLQDGVNVRYLAPGAKRPERHQLLLEFEDGGGLSCTIQMYGGIMAFPAGQNDNFYYVVTKQRPSPLSDQFDGAYFAALWEGCKPNLSAKAFLATEQRIPGLGNGCLQDILFRAKIHPKRKLETMGEAERDRLFRSLKDTLREMAEQGGRDTEKDLFGESGRYQTYLSAKTWKGVCPVCGGPITRQAYLGGNVYFCAHCQAL